MDIAQITRLEEQGTVLNLRPGVPFSIQEPDKIWLVLGGRIDLFLVEMRDGEPAGARHHLMRVETGDPVIGFNKPCDAAVGVIANPAAGSKVLCLELKQLQQSAGYSPETIIPLIDRWVENLGSAVAGEPAPKNFQKLAPGGEVAIEDKPAAILPLTGVVWVRHLQGNSTLLGNSRLPPLVPGSFFPVSRVAWLLCAPQTRVTCLDTPDWLEADRQWSGLRQFQDQLFAYFVVEQRREEQREQARLQAVRETDARLFEAALYKLAEPLRGGEEKPLEVEAGALDPLLQVCRLVGNAAGVQIPQILRVQELIKQQDPVNAIAKASRIRTRRVILKGKWWDLESAPMVGFYELDKRPVALLPGRRGYQLYDPAARRKIPVDEELAGKLHGFAYVFYRPFPPKVLTIADIFSFGLRGCKGDASTIILMGIGAGLLGMVTPVLTGIMFDTIIPGAQHRSLVEFSIFFVISAVAMVLFTLTRSLATLRLQSKMEASVQAAVWDRLLALPVPFFRKFTSGDLAKRSLGISQIRATLTGSALASIFTGIFSVTSCALMFYYSWRLALIAAILVFFSFLVFVLCSWLQVRILRGVSEIGGRISGMTLQFINGLAKFRVAGTEARVFGVWAREFAKQRLLSMKARKISNLVSVFNSALPVLAWSVIFYSAITLMRTPDSQALTTGEFLAFLAAFGQFSTGTLDLSSALTSVLNVVPLYERAKPILTSLPEVTSAKTDPGELTGSIDIHHVSFRYRETGPLVLRDVSISISSGQFLAIVGPSGSGKSTLFRLLMGFETAGAGAIYYDGQDLAELDLQAVRRQIGVVLQNARLMTGSIFQNIVESGTLTIDDAWEAARHAGLEEDLEGMPMGMHTIVSEGGGGLSGGQRQRLLIARAIVRKPRILLFDEATSALDNRTQAIVTQSLKALNATRVVIAHRLSTVMHADRICVLDRGSLVESGTYDELMGQGGLFTQLAKRQLS
jgi:NHLM bacteriocin system ABC transporter ATP-binding protein